MAPEALLRLSEALCVLCCCCWLFMGGRFWFMILHLSTVSATGTYRSLVETGILKQTNTVCSLPLCLVSLLTRKPSLFGLRLIEHLAVLGRALLQPVEQPVRLRMASVAAREFGRRYDGLG